MALRPLARGLWRQRPLDSACGAADTPAMRAAVFIVLALAPSATGQHCPAPLGTTDWSAVDAYAMAADERNERSVESLARYLRRAGRTDAARIRAVYRWVAGRVAYDVPALTGRRPSQSADTTLATLKGVCEGYARLSVALLTEMGIEARFVGGWALPRSGTAAISPDGLHAWVAARAGRRWVLMDPTWGAGTVHGGAFRRGFNARWFAPPPDLLAQTHIPEVEAMQLLASPLSLDDAVARRTPEAVCLDAPGQTVARHSMRTRVSASGEGPPWRTQHGVRFRLLSAVPTGGFSAQSEVDLAVEVDGAHAVAAFDGRVMLRELRGSRNVWRGRVRLGAEPLRIGVKTGRSDPWRIVLALPVR